MPDKNEIWFATYRVGGLFLRRVPVHWKGWVIQLAAIALFFISMIWFNASGLIKQHPLLCMAGSVIGFIAVLSIGRQHHEKRY